MSHPIVHWEIGGPDATVLRKFYAEAFGWSMTEVDPNYTLVDAGAGLPGGIMRTRGGMPPYVTVYIRVDDLDATLAEIGRCGGSTVVPPTSIGEAMSFALFSDPGGAVVGILQATEA